MIGGGKADGAGRERGRVHVARAELTLAVEDTLPLRAVPLTPDPLTAFARAYEGLRDDLGETAEVCLDLLPLTPAQRRARRRKAIAAERGEGGRGGTSIGDQLTVALWGGRPSSQRAGAARPPAGGLRDMEIRAARKATSAKLVSVEPMFAVQVLVRVRSEVAGRPEAHLHAILAAFEQWTGDNWWRTVGRRVGWVHLGADSSPWARARFDQRVDTGLFRPAKECVVTATEIAGFLKPPTVSCAAPNVARSGGVIPPPPQGLPEYRVGDPKLLPLGVVATRDGDRSVGVRLDETFFSLSAGRSRFGKTEGAISRFIALARAGHGCFFLDPHADALARMKPYLVDIADRVLEINLASGRQARQAGWNLFSMEGRGPEDVEARVSAVVDSFASALQWGEVNNRALTLTTMAAQSMCELALAVPPDMAPTLFQMTTILSDEDWRTVVLPYLSPATRGFWANRFAKLSSDAITPVTNLIDRLRSSAAVAALLGSSRSTYNIRKAMDSGSVVLCCPAGIGDKDRLLANFFIYDLLQASLSRRDITNPSQRRPFHCFIDEMQTIDGAAKGNLAALLEQCGKFGLRLHAMVQQPTRLTKTTLDALLTNRSHLMSTVVGAESARLLAREWGGRVAPETITSLDRYTFVSSVTLDGQVSDPFLVRGFEVGELWGEYHQPDGVPDLDKAIDVNLARRSTDEVLADLDTLDERIADYLGGSAAVPAADEARPPTRGSGLRLVE